MKIGMYIIAAVNLTTGERTVVEYNKQTVWFDKKHVTEDRAALILASDKDPNVKYGVFEYIHVD